MDETIMMVMALVTLGGQLGMILNNLITGIMEIIYPIESLHFYHGRDIALAHLTRA